MAKTGKKIKAYLLLRMFCYSVCLNFVFTTVAVARAPVEEEPLSEAKTKRRSTLSFISQIQFLLDTLASSEGLKKFNDTGIYWCANNAENFLACEVDGFAGQDGDYGRDALARIGQLKKVGSGAAGFDFTKLDADGNALPETAKVWSCVRDNYTGLIWEVKTNEGGLRDWRHSYTWYNPDSSTNGGDQGVKNGGSCSGSACDTYSFVQEVNRRGLCGATDWRMPTRVELLSIVHNGVAEPSIDTVFFPNTRQAFYWTSSASANNSEHAWLVHFSDGGSTDVVKDDDGRVRLVRNAL